MAVPVFFWQTKVAWIDDDQLFLNAGKRLLEKKFSILPFFSPEAAVDFFSGYKSIFNEAKFIKDLTESDNYELSDHMPVDANIACMRGFRNQAERMNEISVMIVDQDMPGISGIELCKQLSQAPVMKILFTGKADYCEAVQAFNEGTIHCFLKKESPSIMEELKYYLNRLSEKYFLSQTDFLGDFFTSGSCAHLSDPVFVDYFKYWCRENHIIEHYIFDKNCNFFMRDYDNQHHRMVIYTEKKIKNFLDLYRDERGTKEHLDFVERKVKLPWFGEETESWQVEFGEWSKHFYAPYILHGKETFYILNLSGEDRRIDE